jgi:hypothetical protein
MELFMTGEYIMCVGKITIAICTYPRILYVNSSLMNMGSTSEDGWRRTTSRYITPRYTNERFEAVYSVADCVSIDDVSFKVGVLCLLNRIFRQSGRWYRIAIHTTFCLVLAITFAQVLIPFINSRPFSKNWRPEEPGICAIAGLSLWRYLDIPNVSTTLFTVAIPLPALVKLHVTQGTKLGLVVVFGVCVLGVGAAIMRVRSFLEVVDFNDITYQNVKPLCWTIVESGIYVVAGVLPTFKPLLRKIFKDTALGTLLSRSSQGSTSSERKWFCRGQNKGSPRDALSGAEKQHSLSELTVETAVSVETDSPRRDTSRTRDAEARQLHW